MDVVGGERGWLGDGKALSKITPLKLFTGSNLTTRQFHSSYYSESGKNETSIYIRHGRSVPKIY